jgi:hypothetical protein
MTTTQTSQLQAQAKPGAPDLDPNEVLDVRICACTTRWPAAM